MYEELRPMLKSVGQGAATQCYVATHPDLASVSGVYFSDCAPAEPLECGRAAARAAQLAN